MERVIAFTDIHGCFITFQALWKQVSPTQEDRIFFLGDYIDRGPESKAVIDFLIKLPQQGFQCTFLRGNHEQFLLSGLRMPKVWQQWLNNADGRTTLESYGYQTHRQFPKTHLNFLEKLEYFATYQHFIFVHAGLNFKLTDPLEDQEEMLWIRNWYQDIDREWLANRIIVHGHTPTPARQIASGFNNYSQRGTLNLDGGCFHIRKPGMGTLVAADLTNDILYQQKNIDAMTDWWIE